MPTPVLVTGGFVCHRRPVQGLVRFTPERLWVVEDGTHWAALAPETLLDPTGTFTVYLTPTDTDPVPWRYQVSSPGGVFYIQVPASEVGYSLKELIGGHHPGPRPTNR